MFLGRHCTDFVQPVDKNKYPRYPQIVHRPLRVTVHNFTGTPGSIPKRPADSHHLCRRLTRPHHRCAQPTANNDADDASIRQQAQ